MSAKCLRSREMSRLTLSGTIGVVLFDAFHGTILSTPCRFAVHDSH